MNNNVDSLNVMLWKYVFPFANGWILYESTNRLAQDIVSSVFLCANLNGMYYNLKITL